MTESKTMSVDQMAKCLNISRQSAYALCKRDGFPSVRVTPRRIVIPCDLLDNWLAQQAQEAVR